MPRPLPHTINASDVSPGRHRSQSMVRGLPNLVFLGPPGSGKGTQGQILADRYGYRLIGMGQLLRERAARPDALGRRIAAIIGRGHLVPGEVMGGVLRDHLEELPDRQPIIFDGVPRALRQAETLERLLETRHWPPPIAVYIKLPRSAVIERLARRRVCEQCGTVIGLISALVKEVFCPKCGRPAALRHDDRAEVIEVRLNTFFRDTLPVIDYYRARGRLKEVDGAGTVEEVTEQIIHALKFE